MRTLRLGAVSLCSLSREELFRSGDEGFRHVATVNAEIFTLVHQDRELGLILQSSLNTIDGRIVQALLRIRYGGPVQKQSGSDFLGDLANWCAIHGLRLYLLGASEESNRQACSYLQERFAELQVEGYSPPFDVRLSSAGLGEEIRSKLATFQPHHLVVCFGPPRQEQWIAANREFLERAGIRVAYGLGGAMDFISGAQKRAPKWVQVCGAEWLYRCLRDPRRRLGRTLRMFLMPYYAVCGSNRSVLPTS